MKAASIFATLVFAVSTFCAPAQAAEDWFQHNGTTLDALGTGRTLAAKRCRDVNRSPAERIEQCKANTANGGNESWVALGDALQEAGDFPSAIHAYTMALGSSPTRESIYILRGQSFALNGQYDKALEDAGESITEDKGTGFVGRCLIRAIAGTELNLALEDCDTATGYIYHDNTQVLQARALIHFKQGDLKATLADCNLALTYDENLDWASYICAIAQRKLGNSAVADAELAKAIQNNPYIADIYARYGVPSDPAVTKP